MSSETPKQPATEHPGKEAVETQLARITESPEFDTSKRAADFLRFVVTETLSNRMDQISQHSIASAVFGRGEDFDPLIDPIVRMQAGRVRRSLEHYYLTKGAKDPVGIGLPKGTYVPVFTWRLPVTAPSPIAVSPWPTLLISPLHNLTGRPETDFIAQGLASDLAAELSRDHALHVFLAPSADESTDQSGGARFTLGGTISMRGDDLKLNFHLIDRQSGRQIWAETFFCATAGNQGPGLDHIVQATATMVCEEQGILSRHFEEESHRTPPAGNTAYEAILKYLHFDVSNEPAAYDSALAALLEAVESHPDCAVCWSYLARLGGSHWSLGIPGEPIPIEQSITAARRGAGLAPRDVRCRATLSYLLLLADEVDEARHEAEVALELNGTSIFWLDAIGYLLSLAGDWGKGPAIVRQALEINPFPRRACYGALWLDGLLRDDPAAALNAARQYAPESYFWAPLMEAVALVADHRVEDAAVPARQLLKMKPDFSERGHWLITRYVKSPDLVRTIETTLGEVGIRVPAN